jgi:hypothetical protein
MREIRLQFRRVHFRIVPFLILAVLILASFANTPKAFASTMTKASVLETDMIAAASSGTVYVDFKAGAADSSSTLTVNFTGFTVNATQSISTGTCAAVFSGASPLPTTGTLSAAGATTIVTVSSVNNLTSGTQYCFALTSSTALTNPVVGNYNAIAITDGTDTTTVGVDVVSNDQISVTASVPPSFTLAFGGNSDTLGALSKSSATSSTGVTLTVTTNAASGWGLWAEDTNAGLSSTAASHTIATAATGSNFNFASHTNAENYGLGVLAADNPTANYSDSGSTGSGLSTSVYNEIASNTTPSAGSAEVVKELANISGTTPAAVDYGDTITIVGAGSF